MIPRPASRGPGFIFLLETPVLVEISILPFTAIRVYWVISDSLHCGLS
jgi:hypothetical protein